MKRPSDTVLIVLIIAIACVVITLFQNDTESPNPTTRAQATTAAASAMKLDPGDQYEDQLAADRAAATSEYIEYQLEQAEACLIKGNISFEGEKIYHMPGDEFYEATKINAAYGERWFCTAEDAEANGWRRAR